MTLYYDDVTWHAVDQLRGLDLEREDAAGGAETLPVQRPVHSDLARVGVDDEVVVGVLDKVVDDAPGVAGVAVLGSDLDV